MSHYAQIKNGIVQQVIVAEQDFINTLPDAGDWIEKDYYTFGNQHRQGLTPMRGNYAGVGFVYDSTNDVFHESQPFPSWRLNHSTWLWEAPHPYPDDKSKKYVWSEAENNWVGI